MKVEVEYELARNVRKIARLDIAGGGQIVVEGGYAYVGHMKPPMGTSIIDVRDPAKPVVVHADEITTTSILFSDLAILSVIF